MFDDIRPFTDAEISAAMQRMADHPLFPKVCGWLFPERPAEQVAAAVRGCRTAEEFQLRFMLPVVESIVEKTTDGVTCTGLEKLDPGMRYLFVSNHRDIALDAAIFQVLLTRGGHRTSEISFGANLMAGDFVIDFGKSNKMYRVERPDTVSAPRAFLDASRRLSAYIRDTVTRKGESVWIAQRNGRTKDGRDFTDQGIIKMFGMSGKGDQASNLADLHIVPLSVSYEWEPCELGKAVERYCIRHHGSYAKQPGEDLASILDGVMRPKGRVAFHVGAPVTREDLAPFAGLPHNRFNKKVCDLLDGRIRPAFRLYPNNYVAADLISGQPLHADRYAEADVRRFQGHLDEILSGLPALLRDEPGAPEEIRMLLTDTYAAPVLQTL